jgi:hypothetical protein
MNERSDPTESESLDLDFRESQPAITQALRKRVAKAWANAEQERDEQEGELWNLSR